MYHRAVYDQPITVNLERCGVGAGDTTAGKRNGFDQLAAIHPIGAVDGQRHGKIEFSICVELERLHDAVRKRRIGPPLSDDVVGYVCAGAEPAAQSIAMELTKAITTPRG